MPGAGDDLERIATRTPDEIKRLSELKIQIISDVDKKIKDAEDSMK